MHTANRLSRLSSSLVKLRQFARIVFPGLLVISATFGISFIEARRGDNVVTPESAALPVTVIMAPEAATITVNNAGEAVANDGQCTLREAITAANTNTASGAAAGECAAGMAGADNIVFALGTGTPTINLSSPLPVITQPLTIKGNTGGATRIELNGAGAGASANGLTISAGNTVIERLVINRFTANGIEINGSGFNTVKGCIIGLDTSGTIARANNIGLAILGSSDNVIGGLGIGERNTISANTVEGVLIKALTSPSAIAASRNRVVSNYIGTDVTGRFDFGNAGFGVNVFGGDLTVIGGATAAERNVISGNNGGGVRIGEATGMNNRIVGNYIGTDVSGTYPLGNGGGGGIAPGVLIENAANNWVGGTATSDSNFIRHNLQNGGVVVVGNPATGNRILGNSISENAGLGIDLGNNGISPNDPLDIDPGPNNGQNSPQLTLVIVGSSSTTVWGSLNSLPARSFRIEFFYNIKCDSNGAGEGLAKFGETFVTTNATGDAGFTPTFNDVAVPKGQSITATATLLDVTNNPVETSEFSACLVVPGSPTTCTAALIPPAQNMRSPGGSFSVDVSLQALCPWVASSSVPWATISSGSPGLGSGTVVVNVSANTGAQRVGQLTIAGKDFYVTQDGPCTASVNPPGQNFAAGGGLGSFEFISGGGCAWTAMSTANWITLTTASSGSGPTVVDFSIAPNTTNAQRGGAIIIGGQFFAVTQDAPCTPTINPTQQQFTSTGGSNSASVTIGTGCNWTATTNDSWITINSGASGTGNGTVSYSVAANPGGQRSGLILVGGKTLNILQEGACMPMLNPNSKSFGSSANSSSVGVTIGAACAWSVSTAASWITITSPLNNTGNGTVNFSVTANPGQQRSGTIVIAGLNFNVTQDGACDISISPSVRQLPVEGGNSSTSVSVASGCNWTATATAPWINITSGASGTGNGTVNFSVTTNSTGSQRSGTITIGDKTLNVLQDGGCTYTVSPTSQNFAAAGGNSTANVTTTSGCAWLATSNAAWITITSSLSPNRDERFFVGRYPAAKNGIAGTGNGTVAYTVAANTGPPRTGTMNIAGTVFTVTQDSGCPINITPANLPAATVGTNYNQQLTQSGVVGSPTWTITSGSLPGGMNLGQASGLISGMPASTGSFNFTVRVAGTNGCYGEIPYVLIVNCPTLSIAPTTLNAGTVGAAYSQQLTLTGGSGAMTWIVNAGSLPVGMALDQASGLLSGIPAAQGKASFTVRATVNASGCFVERNYSLTINCPMITVSPTTISNGNLGVPYNQQFTQTGGTGNITWSLSVGSLPNNMTLSTAGLLSGTPVMAGNYPITVRATDGSGCFGERSYTLVIGTCPTITITPNSLPNGLIGVNYNQTLTATGGTPAYNFTVSAGLPSGLTLSSAGVLSGVSNVVGSFSFTVTATDQSGCAGTKNYTLQICGAITVNPATLPTGTVGANYNQTLTASGGAGSYSFSSSGTLPNGLTLTSGGVLSGIPTATGTFNFSVTATDTNFCTGSRNYSIVVGGTGLMFYPLARPIRLLDTRSGQPGCDAPGVPIPGGTSRTQTAAGRTCDGITIPANAKALAGNVTTIGSGGGYLTLYPSDATQPTVANSNYLPNEILNNVFTVGLGSVDGAFKIFVTSNTHLTIDVTGYYAPPGAGGLYFHPLTSPIRLLETRAGQPGCDAPGVPIIGSVVRTQPSRITCNGVTIPANAAAIVGNATVVNPGGAGYMTLYPSNASRPLVASSNFGMGQLMNAPFTVGLGNDGAFNIYSTNVTDLVIDVLGYYSPDPVDVNGDGLLFNPLPRPVRLLETRAGYSGCYTTNAPLLAGSTRNQQARGLCDGMTIGATARAIVGNATVVYPQTGGYQTFWPSNVPQPYVANSNFQAGQIFNRHLTVGLGTDGVFKIFTTATTDLVIDVSGFFAP